VKHEAPNHPLDNRPHEGVERIAAEDEQATRQIIASQMLAENGIIEQDFAVTAYKMDKMVGMRNRLVHLYWEVDAAIVYEVLQNNLNDFERFKTYVYNFMRRLESSQREEEPGG